MTLDYDVIPKGFKSSKMPLPSDLVVYKMGMVSSVTVISPSLQWQFQSCQVIQAGDTRGVCGKLMGGEKFGPSHQPIKPYSALLVMSHCALVLCQQKGWDWGRLVGSSAGCCAHGGC